MASLWNGCAAERGPDLRTEHHRINEGPCRIDGNRLLHLTRRLAGKVMNGFATTVLTLADDETQPEGAALSIMEGSRGDGQSGPPKPLDITLPW